VGGRGIDRPEDRCVPQTLLEWVKRAQTDSGERPGVSTSEARRVKELERKVKELRRANEILKLASAFFAQAELDRRLKVSNGMDAPTRSGNFVPKWRCYFNHLNREGRPS